MGCTNFKGMFENCSSLNDIEGIEKWKDKNQAIDFHSMFINCLNLLSLDIIEKN